MADVQLNTRGVSSSQALQALSSGARDTLLLGLLSALVSDGYVVKVKDDGSGIEGLEIVEEVPADPDDIAAGTNTTLATTIASHQFWRRMQTVSIADASPFNIVLDGSTATPSSTHHTMNLLMDDVNAAVTWQIAAIASGLKGSEGKITFVQAGSTARNCYPQNHATSGASVRYADGIVQTDLQLPASSGSRLTVYYEIITDGSTGLFEITGFKLYTAP